MNISHFLVLVFIGFLFVKKNFRVKLFDMIQKNKIFLVGGSLLAIYIITNEPFVVEGAVVNTDVVVNTDHCHSGLCPSEVDDSTTPSEVDDSTTPEPCPVNSKGEGGGAQCTCKDGFSGTIKYNGAAYEGTCEKKWWWWD